MTASLIKLSRMCVNKYEKECKKKKKKKLTNEQKIKINRKSEERKKKRNANVLHAVV